MTLDSKGRLTVAGHAARNIWRLESLDLLLEDNPRGHLSRQAVE